MKKKKKNMVTFVFVIKLFYRRKVDRRNSEHGYTFFFCFNKPVKNNFLGYFGLLHWFFHVN